MPPEPDTHESAGKHAPSAVPPVTADLAENVRRAADDRDARREIRVRLDVEGGQHEDRYEFRFEAAGSGEVESRFRSKLRSREYGPKTGELAPRDFTGLLRTIDVGELLEAAKAMPRIPPDSLVGRLLVSDGRQEVSVIFMADPEQAKTAGYEAPATLEKAVERIYALADRNLGAKDIRP